MNKLINELIDYALFYGMIEEEDVDYSANRILDVMQGDSFERNVTNFNGGSCVDILEKLLLVAIDKNIIDDEITVRDLFDTRIMDCIMKRPSEVISTFNHLYKEDPIKATQYYYNLSINSNYIRKSRTDKNVVYDVVNKYGKCIISINLSKPEKNPEMIAKLALMKSSSYPTCVLCKENVGFAGNLQANARQTHRIIPFKLGDNDFYLQYSPYVYYNEHCIIFNKEHTPMVIDHNTFKQLLNFVDIFPHYMIGSNADLPIVGGSILSHEHFQGGCFHFPIYDAKVIDSTVVEGVKVEMLYWPLSTIRLVSDSYDNVLKLANRILDQWINYNDESVSIVSHTGSTRHNTITPIVRSVDQKYCFDLVLRNNRTSEQHPLGIFHPHDEVHHIKKENIGLIEVMGLAILPARLLEEIALIKDCLLGNRNFEDYDQLSQHFDWYNRLKQLNFTKETIDELLEQEVGLIFERVLEDAGVFKMNEKGIEAFKKFIALL